MFKPALPPAGARLIAATVLAFGLYAGGPATAEVSHQLELRFAVEEGGESFKTLRKFYLERGFQPIWIEAGAANAKARALAEVLAHADEDGLVPAVYRAEAILRALDSRDDAELADLEFNLSRAMVRYGGDLSAGRVEPAQIDPEHYIYPTAVTAEKLLAVAASDEDLGKYLAGLAPQSQEYERLKAALASYRELAKAGGWNRVPDGETLKPGMSDRRVQAIRRRLIASNDVVADAPDTELYDEVLEGAIRRFQFRHGLEVDGAVGKNTLAALNVPVEARVEQMLLNMERRRWMADDLGQSYVFVNLADFVLKVVDGPKTILDTRVIVGKTYHRTPVFSDLMRYIVINPYWTVPPSIAGKELLPKLRKDPNYLADRNIKMFASWDASAREVDARSIDWTKVSRRQFNYKLRQEPGEDNALGHLKFMFPNRFNIYLHDTPSRNLFERAVRSFSHGCIRVQYPATLAATLLRDVPGWSEEEIKAAIASGSRQTVNLKTPVPVHVTYLTAWVNKDKSVHFRDDLYGRDERLRKALGRLQ